MRRAIAPFLATGVVLSGAAVVVANPVVPRPSEIRVSASDFAANGEQLDVLDPQFLESIGAIRQDWLSSIEVLQRLFTDVANSNRESSISAFGELAGPPPLLVAPELTVSGTSHERALMGHPTVPVPDPHPTVEGIVGALTDIGTSFGESGINFVRQVTLAPTVAFVLVQQVAGQLFAGEIGPDEAVRRLVVEPLSALLVGHPHLTGIDEIDKAFHESALKPLIRALIRNLPKPIGQPGGLIDDVDHTVDGAVGDIRDGLVPQRNSQTVASDATPETTTTPGALEPPETTEPSGTAEPIENEGTIPPANFEPGGVVKGIGQQINRALDDFRSTVKRFSAGNRKDNPAQDSGKSDGADPVEDKDEPAGEATSPNKPDGKQGNADDKPADDDNESTSGSQE